MSIKITCIKKDLGHHDNPHVAISTLGWINEQTSNTGKSTRMEIYDWLLTGGNAYVYDNIGNKAKLITAQSSNGTKYVKTESDNTTADNLLKLPECG